MKTKIRISTICVLSALLWVSCTTDNKKVTDDSGDEIEQALLKKDLRNVKKIFYNIPSPIEMSSLMQRAGTIYNTDILNPISNQERYTTNASLALNLGVYGADLSYIRVFDQMQESINYLSAIKKISEKLGIPEEQGRFTLSRLEQNVQDRDTLLQIISDTYAAADVYLKENEREGIAALIILGGWSEALYLATSIVNEKDPSQDMINRIAEQKYSFNNLKAFLADFSDEAEIQKFSPFIDQLDKVFNKITIIQEKGEILTDTENKLTTINYQSKIDASMEQIIEINGIICNLRGEIIK